MQWPVGAEEMWARKAPRGSALHLEPQCECVWVSSKRLLLAKQLGSTVSRLWPDWVWVKQERVG